MSLATATEVKSTVQSLPKPTATNGPASSTPSDSVTLNKEPDASQRAATRQNVITHAVAAERDGFNCENSAIRPPIPSTRRQWRKTLF